MKPPDKASDGSCLPLATRFRVDRDEPEPLTAEPASTIDQALTA